MPIKVFWETGGTFTTSGVGISIRQTNYPW